MAGCGPAGKVPFVLKLQQLGAIESFPPNKETVLVSMSVERLEINHFI